MTIYIYSIERGTLLIINLEAFRYFISFLIHCRNIEYSSLISKRILNFDSRKIQLKLEKLADIFIIFEIPRNHNLVQGKNINWRFTE